MAADKKDKQKAAAPEQAPIEALRLEANEQLLLLRKEPGETAFGFVALLGEGENRLPIIKERYGGGDYWVRTQKSDSGQWVANKSARFQIVGPPKVEVKAAPAGPAAEALLWLKALGEMMPKPGAAADPMAIAAAMAQANATSLAAVLGILTPLITQQQKGAGSDVGSVVSAVRDVVGLAKDLQPEPAGNGDPIYRTIAAPLLQLLTKLADGAPRQRKLQLVENAPRAAPGGGGGEPAPPATPPPGGAPAVSHPLWPHIQPFLPELVRLARAGKNVDLYADVVLDNLPDDVYAALTGHLSDLMQVDALEAALVAADPAVAEQREWFHGFLRAVFDALHAPEDGAPAPAAAG